MKKKLIISILCTALTVGLIAGCGSTQSDTSIETVESVVEPAETSEVSEETVEEDPCKDGHTWIEATCTEPKTCSVCGETEGEPLEHEWENATLDAPKTCKLCGLTEGDPVQCVNCTSFINDELSAMAGSGWRISQLEDSFICLNKLDESIEISSFDFDGTPFNKVSVPMNSDWGWCFGEFGLPYEHKLSCYVSLTHYPDNEIELHLYDHQGNELVNHQITKYMDEDQYIYSSVQLSECTDHRYYAVVLVKTQEVIEYLDRDTMEFFDAEDEEHALAESEATEEEELDYDHDRFSSCSAMEGVAADVIGGYLVANPDKSQWGYVDGDFNELAMYADASDFNNYGYALVSDDGESYSIIDTNLNVIAKDFVKSSGGGWSDGIYLIVSTENGDEYYWVH